MDGRRLARVSSFAASLPQREPDAWRSAVEHRFVRAIADGSLQRESFDRWIRQDRLFVRGLRRVIGRLHDRAPDDDRIGLQSGLAALDPELELFDSYAAERGIDLLAPPSDECAAYLAFLGECVGAGYLEGLVAYYGCERAYLEAWSGIGRSDEYADWVANWTSAPFRAYVDWLGERVDAIAVGLDEPRQSALAKTFGETVRHEVAFWDSCL